MFMVLLMCVVLEMLIFVKKGFKMQHCQTDTVYPLNIVQNGQ